MKCKVINIFSDKETGSLYVPGSFFEGNQKRVNDLIKLGFLEGSAIEPTEKPRTKRKKSGD